MSQQATAILQPPDVLTSRELEVSLAQARARHMSLLDLLVVERDVPEETLAEAFSTWLNIPHVRLDSVDVEEAAVKAVAGSLARKHLCLPLGFARRSLVLAMANPMDQDAIVDVQFASSRDVRPVVACRSEILVGLDKHYPSAPRRPEAAVPADDDVPSVVTGDSGAPGLDRAELPRVSDNAPAVHLFNQIILDAIKWQASDIHIEPGPSDVHVRLSVDGVLRDCLQFPRWMRTALVSRVKMLARLNVAEQRRPQDGQIEVRTRDQCLDLRVSTRPTPFGEKAVLRLLGSSNAPTLGGLGFPAAEAARLEDALCQPQGVVLVSGPAGAGVSTTLHAMLTRRLSSGVDVITIEDPIEYYLPGATQVQVDDKAGLTFAGCLRASLRQDPDVVVVGEMRDLETAEIAFRAALTGRLILSTLRADGSLSSIARLLDLGVEAPLIATATNLIVAQRLARRICTNCREPYAPSPEALRRLRIGLSGRALTHGRGCPECAQTGYAGRVGIFEILRMTPELKELVTRGAPESELRRAATAAGTRFLLDDALHKVGEGLTTVEEILRCARGDASSQTAAG